MTHNTQTPNVISQLDASQTSDIEDDIDGADDVAGGHIMANDFLQTSDPVMQDKTTAAAAALADLEEVKMAQGDEEEVKMHGSGPLPKSSFLNKQEEAIIYDKT